MQQSTHTNFGEEVLEPGSDTIPPSIKPHFFKDRQPPGLISDYDVIGFDADHCFVKYNITELTRLIVSGHLKILHKDLGYPKEILDFDYENNLGVVLNNAVWDI